jgi:hypothetical protein
MLKVKYFKIFQNILYFLHNFFFEKLTQTLYIYNFFTNNKINVKID